EAGTSVREEAPAAPPVAPAVSPLASRLPPPALLDPEISQLAFQERVLALAESPATPLRERLRFLSIVAANIDEFFTVRIAGLKLAALEQMEENLSARFASEEFSAISPDEQLARLGERVRVVMAQQQRALRACLADVAAEGVHLRTWRELAPEQRAELRELFRDEVFPALTPLAMTLSPGHPFPKLPHLGLSLALVLADDRGGAPHFADVELPRGV